MESQIPIGVMVLLTLFSGANEASADTDPPEIRHEPIEQAAPGQELSISAIIEDESGVFAPSLYIRSSGETEYTSLEMEGAGEVYSARVPAEAAIGTLEYFIEAFDQQGNGPARSGTPTAPIVLTFSDSAKEPVVTTPPIVAAPPASPVLVHSTPPAEPEPGITDRWWFWTVIAVAVAGGAAATVLLVTRDSGNSEVNLIIRGPDPSAGP